MVTNNVPGLEGWNYLTYSTIWGCEYNNLSVTSKGFFQGDDPFNHSLTAILMQLGTAIFITTCLRRILKPLNQPRFVAEMLQITQEYFIVIALTILFNASVSTPILRYIYDPSKRYINYKRRTIQHTRHESELKTLVCIHEEDDVFGLMNILKACYPTKKTPIVTYALDIMELIGRMTPIFINHQFHKHQSLTATTNRTDRIISAFQQFENQYEGIKRYNFTIVAPYNSMHDEICTLALDKSVSLLIIPFQKSEAIPRRGVKRNVLNKAPCSVGILVNKRIVLSRNVHSLGYNTCLVYLGGPDSREALAFVMRMLENPFPLFLLSASPGLR